MTRVRNIGERVEELLTLLRSVDARAADTAEELVRLLVGLYGDGLGRIVAALTGEDDRGMAMLERLTADPLIEALLLLHDLHPVDVGTRIQRALDRVRPYLGSHAGGVRYLGVTDGVARLRLEGSCHGCPSSTVTVRLAVQDAVQDAAPEVTEVVVEGMTDPRGHPLLQIGPRPASESGMVHGMAGPGGLAADVEATAGAPASAAGGAGWVSLPGVGRPSSVPVAVSAGTMPVLVCAVRGTLFAYRNACAVCGSPMDGGKLDREVLTCQCGARYDVQKAGRGVGDNTLHLDPLPLLSDSQGVRVAVPAAAVRS